MKHMRSVSRPGRAQDIPISQILSMIATVLGVLGSFLAEKEEASAAKEKEELPSEKLFGPVGY